MKEWAATNETFITRNNIPCVPIPPEGKDWRLVAAVLCNNGISTGPVWYWERDVPDVKVAQKTKR